MAEEEAKTPEKESTQEATDSSGPEEAPKSTKPEQTQAPEETRTAPPLPEGVHYIWGTGRRKKAIARVRIRPGTGKFLINKREVDDYFREERDRKVVQTPLVALKMLRSWDVWVNVGGGGFTGQAGAVTLGLARALAKALPDEESALREDRLLTRDARMKERKKYGQPGARKRFQYSKR
jgi:small subunit ribosomal protein S9